MCPLCAAPWRRENGGFSKVINYIDGTDKEKIITCMKVILIMKLRHPTLLTMSAKSLMTMVYLQPCGGFLKTPMTDAILNILPCLRKVFVLASLELRTKRPFDQESFSRISLA